MEEYQKLVRGLLEEAITERLEWDDTLTREDVFKQLNDEGFEDIFGNMTGSRTCNTYEAQQFIDKSGAIWDDDIIDLFREIEDGYFESTLKRGAETLDVVICELLGSRVLYEMAEAEGIEL